MFRCDPEPAQRLGTCSSAGLGASPAGAGCSLSCPATGAVASPPSPVPSRPAQPPASCAPSAPSPEVAAASDMSHSLAGLPLSAPAARALQPSSACKDRKGPAPFHISSEARGGTQPSSPPSPSPTVSPDRDRETLVACGGKGHRHASCNARPRAGASPAGPLCPIPGRQRTEGWIPASLLTPNPTRQEAASTTKPHFSRRAPASLPWAAWVPASPHSSPA